VRVPARLPSVRTRRKFDAVIDLLKSFIANEIIIKKKKIEPVRFVRRSIIVISIPTAGVTVGVVVRRV